MLVTVEFQKEIISRQKIYAFDPLTVKVNEKDTGLSRDEKVYLSKEQIRA